MRGVLRRLEKVESALHCEPAERDSSRLLAVLGFSTAFYLGNGSPNEKPSAALARALEYADEAELNKAIAEDDRSLGQRFSSAEKKQ
jgi:hypothetical protein